MRRLAKSFAANEVGATAIEYGLIAALIGVALITGMSTLSNSINAKFNQASTTISTGS